MVKGIVKLEEKVLIVKLGNNKLDFAEEHRKVIGKYGYVDFARVGKQRINLSDITKVVFKESVKDGNRLFISDVLTDSSANLRYPEYYEEYDLTNADVIRLSNLEEYSMDELLATYMLRNGKDVGGLFKGMAPYAIAVRKE